MPDTNSIQITFEKGSFDKADLPHRQGLYCIYRCTPRLFHTLPDQLELLYIGKAEDIKKRLSDHDQEKACREGLPAGKDLYFTWAPIPDEEMLRQAEAALIRHSQPPRNSDFINRFAFPDTRVTVADPTGTLAGQFDVKCTEETLELL